MIVLGALVSIWLKLVTSINRPRRMMLRPASPHSSHSSHPPQSFHPPHPSITSSSYTQHLSVQGPHNDVLRLVIHVEESPSHQVSTFAEEEPKLLAEPTQCCSHHPAPLRRKISWHNEGSSQRSWQISKNIRRHRFLFVCIKKWLK